MPVQESRSQSYAVDVQPASCVDEYVSSTFPDGVAAAVDANDRRWYEVSVSKDGYDGGSALPFLGGGSDPVLDELAGMDATDIRREIGDAFDGPIGFQRYRPFAVDADEDDGEREAFFYCSGDLDTGAIRDVFQDAVDEIADRV